MKKILGIIVLGLLLSGNAYAATSSMFREVKEPSKKELTLKEITNDFLKNKTVTDLRLLKFTFSYKSNTTTEDSVQYYLYKNFADGTVQVICFVDPKKTICRLP